MLEQQGARHDRTGQNCTVRDKTRSGHAKRCYATRIALTAIRVSTTLSCGLYYGAWVITTSTE